MKSDFPTIAPLTETDIDELIAEIKSRRVQYYGCDRYFDGFFAGSENDGEFAKMNKRVCSTNFPVCASYLDKTEGTRRNSLERAIQIRNHSTRFGISILS